MGDKSKIEWTDATWNPVTGCTKVSQGCKHCYAETVAERFWKSQYPPNEDGSPRKFTDVRLHPERLEQPMRWKRPRRIFVNSMSDLFHERVTDHFIGQVFTLMVSANWHIYQVLTKRPQRMMEWLKNWPIEPTPNIWLGVSVEDQKAADERIPLLLQMPAAVRFVSCEPLLGPVDLKLVEFTSEDWGAWRRSRLLDWVIVGGESGANARPMHPDWARSIRDQCQAAGVPYFFKQWGVGPSGWHDVAKVPVFREFDSVRHWEAKASTWMKPDDILMDRTGRIMKNGGEIDNGLPPFTVVRKTGKKAAGRLLDGREWNEFPEVVRDAHP